MGDDAWEARKRAQEEMYFAKENEMALQRLQGKEKRKSPITGEEMEQLVYKGAVIDRCPTSKGIWLDEGELEQIIEVALREHGIKDADKTSWIKGFFDTLTGKG